MWVILLGFWVLPALFGVIGFQLVPSALNPRITLLHLAASQLLIWFAWALWTPVIIRVSERVPFGRGSMARAVLAHLALSLIVICGQILVVAFVSRSFGLSIPRGLESTLAIGFRSSGDLFVVIYWAIVGAHAALRWYGEWQAQGLVAARLERDLSAAQLTTLRSQLNPHFLFNALNSVVTLIPRDQEGATRMVVRIADLLRATLGMAEEQEITLRRELEMVRNYLDIELVRFPDRLAVRWDVDPTLHDVLVPAFALQPLVENAIVHGVSRRSGAGEIVIGARIQQDVVELSVRDNGPGLVSALTGSRTRNGIGLANLRARLHRLYSSSVTDVTLTRVADGGALATIMLPLHRAEIAA
ncbi:MAG TPA: histidine kinase [Gemmatimonas sp.]|nr:histidine kinase [Gemmatimonas sp.]